LSVSRNEGETVLHIGSALVDSAHWWLTKRSSGRNTIGPRKKGSSMAQFRKSKSFGPVRLTFSNRGVSTSVGAGPLRVSRGADGAWRRTVRIPGTGVSDTKKITQSRSAAPHAVAAVATTSPAPLPGWYPDPAGSGGSAYWNGNAWGGQPPKPPTSNRRLIIGGSVALCFLLLLLIGNCSGPSDNSSTTTATSTVTRTVGPSTVTVTAQPPVATITETAPPSTVTETAQAAPPFVESTPVYAPPLVDIPESASSVYYSNCSEARAAGAAPLYAGEPGYRPGLDRDSDGTACE